MYEYGELLFQELKYDENQLFHTCNGTPEIVSKNRTCHIYVRSKKCRVISMMKLFELSLKSIRWQHENCVRHGQNYKTLNFARLTRVFFSESFGYCFKTSVIYSLFKVSTICDILNIASFISSLVHYFDKKMRKWYRHEFS